MSTPNTDSDTDSENGDISVEVHDIKQQGSFKEAILIAGGVMNVHGGVYFGGNRDAKNSGSSENDLLAVHSHSTNFGGEVWPEDEPEDEVVDKESTRSIAAAYCATSNYKIYFQVGSFIHEAGYIKGNWSITAHISAPSAKEDTPIAAISCPRGSTIHIFYITSENFIHEVYWSASKGWSTGSLTSKTLKVSSYSSLSATWSAQALKVYCQRGSMLCELEYQFYPGDWTFRTLTDALPGTAIACTSYAGDDETVYHVYYQDEDHMLREYVYEFEDELDYDFPNIEAPPYTPLTAISWYIDGAYIRLYFVDNDGGIQELYNEADEKWNEVHTLPSVQKVEKSSQLAALEQNDGRLINLYHSLSEERLAQLSFSKSHDEDPGVRSILNEASSAAPN
ncbi:hypothetical protein DM02DRAFT_731378 [Periconia macrospinosa]|uniref:Uncharacterized protein n=1 Tax=Periconia macrospinosa TaxID=97972 RepID=A0A2V1DDK3_9PLEO|nr:hypothetical protein DM02DRAFT_731378 [Periconia macrospinosa]